MKNRKQEGISNSKLWKEHEGCTPTGSHVVTRIVISLVRIVVESRLILDIKFIILLITVAGVHNIHIVVAPTKAHGV